MNKHIQEYLNENFPNIEGESDEFLDLLVDCHTYDSYYAGWFSSNKIEDAKRAPYFDELVERFKLIKIKKSEIQSFSQCNLNLKLLAKALDREFKEIRPVIID